MWFSETGGAVGRPQGAQTEGPSELPGPCLGPTLVLGLDDVSGEAPSEISSLWQWKKLTSLKLGDGMQILLPNAPSGN